MFLQNTGSRISEDFQFWVSGSLKFIQRCSKGKIKSILNSRRKNFMNLDKARLICRIFLIMHILCEALFFCNFWVLIRTMFRNVNNLTIFPPPPRD